MIYKQPRFYIPANLVAILLSSWLRYCKADVEELPAIAQVGTFIRMVVSPGKLMAEISELMKGSDGLQRYRISDVKINDIISEGT